MHAFRIGFVGLLIVATWETGCADADDLASEDPVDMAAAAVASVTVSPGQLVRGTFPWGGKEREYALYVPSSYDPARPGGYELVVAMHGRGKFPNVDMTTLTKLVQRAEEQGFIAVFPRGTPALNPAAAEGITVWNNGEPNCDFACTPEQVPYCINGCVYESVEDDVGFIVALIDELALTLAIDDERVLATGISNGGQMAILLGCWHADRVKAIAPVAGPVYDWGPYDMPYNRPKGCFPPDSPPDSPWPSRPLQVIDFVGTLDSVYSTNTPAKIAQLGPGVEGCHSEPSWTLATTEGGLKVYRRDYRTCTPGATVESYVIQGGTHCWPGGNNKQLCSGQTNYWACVALYSALCTKTFVADDQMLRFFRERD